MLAGGGLALFPGAAQGQISRAFTQRFPTTNTTGYVTLIGNTLSTCNPAAANCLNARAGIGGTLNNDAFTSIDVDVDADGTTFNSSSATPTLAAGDSVMFAGLYWGAHSNNAARNQVRFATPAAAYATLTATQLDADGTDPARYQGFRDVTAEVRTGGSGNYFVANVQRELNTNRYAGWALVVVVFNSSALPRSLVVFDGYARVFTGVPVAIAVSGLNTPPAGPVNTQLGIIGYEGDLGIVGDIMQLNTTTISDAQNPANNAFNSSISQLGTRFTAKNPDYVNQLSFDADILDASNILPNGATWQARLDALNAAADPATRYYRAKAGAWLDLVRTEYGDNDRTGIVEAGFAAATQLIRQLEAGQTPALETPMERGSQRVLDSLWQRAEQRKQDPAVAAAADAAILAQLEVELLWAGNEALTCGPFDARPHEEEARRLAALLLPWPPPPPLDTDGDGVHDGVDQCPQTPVGAIVDAFGCPPPVPRDEDQDGVDDRLDRCPGTRPGAQVDAMGCALLVVTDTGTTRRALVLRGVNFETGRADLKVESYLVLNDVAASLLANADVRIEIAGHTDDVGQAAANLRLSAARAEAVRGYLIARGVEADRMTARGYGEDLPIAPNTTPAGRAQNRRVELHKLP